MMYKAIVFDLDGVVVTTDEYHYLAWKKFADEINIYFDRDINNRLRGVSRMESLNIVLEKSDKVYTFEEKNDMAQIKNSYYIEMINRMDEDAIIDGAVEFVKKAKEKGLKTAIASSSRNAKLILEKTKLTYLFDAIADGSDIKNSKKVQFSGIQKCLCLNIFCTRMHLLQGLL